MTDNGEGSDRVLTDAKRMSWNEPSLTGGVEKLQNQMSPDPAVCQKHWEKIDSFVSEKYTESNVAQPTLGLLGSALNPIHHRMYRVHYYYCEQAECNVTTMKLKVLLE